MIDVKTIFDTLETRCPRLGGTVPFDYCRKVADGLPCSKSIICWECIFPVGEYMERALTEEEWQAVFDQPSKNRLDTILEIVERVSDKPD